MNYKWRALALLWVAFFLQQGTRQIFGATLTSIQGSLGATAAGIGVVVTVFTFIYGLSVPFAGLAADLFNRKWMVVSGVFVFCLGIFASGFASCLALLVVTYGILNGIGQSFYYPSATSIIGELHKETRATALSILQMGLYVGIIGCSAVSGYLAEGGAEGWRMPFRLFGGIGILWAVVLALGLRGGGCSRKEHKERKVAAAGSPGVSENAVSEGSKPTIKEALAAFVANPAAILLAAGFGMMVYVDIGFKTWMPSHLAESFGLAKGSAALHAVLWHYIVGQAREVASVRSHGDEHRGARARGAVHSLDGIRAFDRLVLRGDGAFRRLARRIRLEPNGFAIRHNSAALPCVRSGDHALVRIRLRLDFACRAGAHEGALRSATGIASLAAFYLLGAVFIAVARARSYGRTEVRRSDMFFDDKGRTTDD